LLLGLTGLVASVAGVLLDADSFLIGLLGGITSLVVTILAAVFVFDRLAEERS
jgi:hypothetical protein